MSSPSLSLTCQTLLARHADLWQSATVHPFLQQCQTGEITPGQFNTWLVQDYLFVLEFTRMAGRLLAAAPVDDFDVLLSGIGALKDELLWFQAKAAERGLALAAEPQAACIAYQDFMQALESQPYAVQAVAFWAIELAYNQGWQRHSPMGAPYAEFAERWGNPGFSEYVSLLERQADSALAAVSAAEQAHAEQAFVEVAELEAAFWQMAFEG